MGREGVLAHINTQLIDQLKPNEILSSVGPL